MVIVKLDSLPLLGCSLLFPTYIRRGPVVDPTDLLDLEHLDPSLLAILAVCSSQTYYLVEFPTDSANCRSVALLLLD